MGLMDILKPISTVVGAATGQWWLPAAVQGASSLASYGSRSSGPSFENTDYGRTLNLQRKQGIYSPTAQNTILGKVGAEAGNVAQGTKSDIRGRLAAMGMGGSIASARALAEPDIRTQNLVSGAAQDLTMKNEASKVDAAREFGQMSGQWNDRRRAEENAVKQDLISGLAGAGMAAWQGKTDMDMTKKFESHSSLSNQLKAMAENGQEDTPEYAEIWEKLFGSAYPGGGRKQAGLDTYGMQPQNMIPRDNTVAADPFQGYYEGGFR